MWRRALSAFGPPALFMLLSAAFLWQPLSTGRVFLPTDLSYKHDYVWRAHTDLPGVSIAQNEVLSDVSDYYYPYAHYAIQRLGDGDFPLWNPYTLTGTPFFASAQAAVLDPINLLTYMAGPLDYWGWAAFLRLALIGYMMFCFMRALGRSMAGAIASGAALMTCGFVTVWLNYSVITTLTWLPALLWATTRMMQTGRVLWMATTGAAMGALFFAGHPETQFLAGFLWGLYSLYWLLAVQSSKFKVQSNHASRFTFHVSRLTVLRPSSFVLRPSRLRQLLLLAGAATLGVGLAAVQILTFAEFLLGSSAIAERTGGVVPFDLGQMALRLAVIFFPNFSGTPIQENYWVPPFTNFNEQTGYIGLLVTALALLGAIKWVRRDRLVIFFAGMGLIAFLLAIRIPGSDLVRSLPLFSIGHGVRWAMVWSLCGAALAGYGVDALLSSPKPEVARYASRAGGYRKVGLWFLGGAIAAAGVLLVLYLGIRDGYWDQAWQPVYSHAKITRLFHPAQLTLYLPVAFLAGGALVLLSGWRRWLKRGSVATLLILLLYAELWTFGSRYNPVTPAPTVYPPTIVTDYLSQNIAHERFAGLQNTLRPNVGMSFELRDMRGFEDVVDQSHNWLYGRFINVLKLANEPDLKLTSNLQRLLNVASVKYLLTLRKPRVDGDPRPYRWLLQDDKVALYENLEVLPRAFVVFSSTVVAPDLQAAKDALLARTNDPRRSVVLSGGGTSISGPDLDLSAAPVAWVKDEPEQIALESDLPAPGYLVLADNYASGWEATVDNQPAPILRANVTFRAVAVPQGRHTISFNYRPPMFMLGAIISGVSAAAIFAIALFHLPLRRRPA
ncbi:MAG TPA: YfhO family protein [Chloroflexia bacterium]|nr:YfhO family protein [Chloroflexia bacterium]